MRTLFVGITIALAVSVTACDRSPTAPSVSATPPPSGGSVSGSASISGLVVLTGASAAPLGQHTSSTLVVTIAGTSISSTVDASGHFTLRNVPSGDLTLAFNGNGIDARITIAAVTDREQIRITVSLRGNNADVDDNERETPDNRAEVEGRIVSISCGATSSSMVVGQTMQTTVLIPAGTPIRHDGNSLACAQLSAGLRVKVKGKKTGAIITATEVQVKDNPGPPAAPVNEVEAKGTVSAIASRSCGTNTITFTVSSSGTLTTVTTNANTKFEDTTCATLAVGNRVEVKGTRQNGSILAAKVEKDDEDEDEVEEKNEAELKGTLGAWDTTKCSSGVASTVSGKPFSTTPTTRFEDTTCAALKQGDTVEVKGTKQANGSVLASRVEKKK